MDHRRHWAFLKPDNAKKQISVRIKNVLAILSFSAGEIRSIQNACWKVEMCPLSHCLFILHMALGKHFKLNTIHMAKYSWTNSTANTDLINHAMTILLDNDYLLCNFITNQLHVRGIYCTIHSLTFVNFKLPFILLTLFSFLSSEKHLQKYWCLWSTEGWLISLCIGNVLLLLKPDL